MEIKCIKDDPSQCRAYQLQSGDEVFCNVEWLECLGYYYELNLGQIIRIYPKPDNIIAKGMQAIVAKRYTHKKYPNKKWWQFWLKQEEYVDGYNLMIL